MMALCMRSSLTAAGRCGLGFRNFKFSKSFSLSAALRKANPIEELVQGRTSLKEQEKAYLLKYASAIETRAKNLGITPEDLLQKAQEKVASENAASASSNVQSDKKVEKQKTQSSTGIEKLSSFLDVEKAKDLPTKELSQLWNAHHLEKPGVLSAVIPENTYRDMVKLATKYPQFVLPVTTTNDSGEPCKMMYMLQWSPSGEKNQYAVIFTPLVEYQARQEFAQPYATAVMYPDFAETHGIILLRAMITPGAAINPLDAQQLLLYTQFFYRSPSNEEEEKRAKLLDTFHNDPGAFVLDDLIKLCDRMT